MVDRIKNRNFISTAYSKESALSYDKKRFTTPQGIIFNKLEMENLNNALSCVQKSSRILEVGCGTGRFILEILKKGYKKIYGLDPSYFMLQQTRLKINYSNNVNLFQAVGSELPYKDGVFDFVYLIRILNQVGSKQYALNIIHEVLRVCSQRGIILLEFVNSKSLSIRGRPCVRFSVREINKISDLHAPIKILRISGILFFTQTILNSIPVWFLNNYARIDSFFAKILPQFCTRCYVVLRKN